MFYLYVSITKTDKRTDYPGKKIAQSVNYEWKKIKENNPKKIKSESINYIGWDEWYAGNLSYNIKGTKVLMFKFVDQLFETEDKNISAPNRTGGRVLEGCRIVRNHPRSFTRRPALSPGAKLKIKLLSHLTAPVLRTSSRGL